MRKLEDHVIYRDARFFCAFPSLCVLGNGDLYVVFRRARDQRYLFGADARSDDPRFESIDHLDSRSILTALRLSPALQPIGEPLDLPVNPEAADQDASLLRLSNGDLILGGFSWYPYHEPVTPNDAEDPDPAPGEKGPLRYRFWGGYTRRSMDEGLTWSPHNYLPPLPGLGDIVPGRRPHHGGALRGRPLELPNGELLLASYGAAPPSQRDGQNVSYLYRSADKGRSWFFAGSIANDRACAAGFVEPALFLTPAGDIVALMRSTGLEGRLVTARSADGGKSWAPWAVHDVVGHPFDAIHLPDGRALLVYGYRKPPFGIRGRLLDPDLKDPGSAEEIVIRDDGPGGDIGYPWAALLPDDRVAVAYYFCDQAGLRYIAASVFSE